MTPTGAGPSKRVDCLLVFPPIRLVDRPRNLPTGLAIVANVLRGAGLTVDVMDINGNRWQKDEVVRRLAETDAPVIGIGGLITVYGYTKWLIRHIRRTRPNTRIIVGGSVATSIPDLFLERNEVDAIVIGEGELTAAELVTALIDGRDISTIDGIGFRADGENIFTRARPMIEDLDTIPMPAWDLLPMGVYLENPVVGVGRDVDVVSSRGCPFGCTYCYRIFGRKYRFYSAERVMAEIQELHDRYDIDFVSFQDDCFILNHDRIYKLCDLLESSGLDLRWSCTGRVNSVNPEILARMRQAGCVSVSFGIESGSQKILDSLNKGATVETALTAVKMVRQAGMRCPTSFMIGSPEETEETLRETVEFCKKANINLTSMMFVTPYPGTELYNIARERGLIEDEEAFIESLADAIQLTVNLSRFSDEQLHRLRDKTIAEVQANYRRPTAEERRRQDLALYGPRLCEIARRQMEDAEMREHRKHHGFNE